MIFNCVECNLNVNKIVKLFVFLVVSWAQVFKTAILIKLSIILPVQLKLIPVKLTIFGKYHFILPLVASKWCRG